MKKRLDTAYLRIPGERDIAVYMNVLEDINNPKSSNHKQMLGQKDKIVLMIEEDIRRFNAAINAMTIIKDEIKKYK